MLCNAGLIFVCFLPDWLKGGVDFSLHVDPLSLARRRAEPRQTFSSQHLVFTLIPLLREGNTISRNVEGKSVSHKYGIVLVCPCVRAQV